MRRLSGLPLALFVILAFGALVHGPRETVPPVIALLLALLGLSLLWALGGLFSRAGARRTARPAVVAQGRPIIVDGSNVMHWDADAGPSLAVLRRVLDSLRDAGYGPIVYFDANAGYKLENRHMGSPELAQRLGLDPAQVTLSLSGTPADPLLLTHAVRDGLRVVTNDRYRDWRAQFPALADQRMRVGGGHKGGQVTLRGLVPAGDAPRAGPVPATSRSR
ncbi:MAG: hypothetical protein GW886_10815 [Rhodobacterales bacterium]|nr:hypothetical protein [Rhodobacterales bacterium]NCT12673.1 hypothetical protein [Rhodobacterales bacterium]